MNLRQFLSNDEKFNKTLPEEDYMCADDVKVLDIKWDIKHDKLVYRINKLKINLPTKRKILQAFMTPSSS